jgi:Uma2 family endonuclease
VSSANQIDDWLSPDDYLSGELKSDFRREYLGGRVYAMAGASEEHNVISLNIAAALRSALRGTPCRAFMNDMKVRIEAAGRDVFYYPDVMVRCGPVGEPRYFKTDPILIFEVLSPDTEGIDRREKFFAYTSLPSLQAYVLVEQERIGVTVFRRGNSGWATERLEAREAVFHLDSPKIDLPLSVVYEDVLPTASS